MKITKFLLFISIVVVLFSCSEDESPLPTSEGMIGTWALTAIDYSGTTTTSYAGQSAKATFTGKGKDMDYTTTFNADPNTITSTGGYTIELKTTMGGQTTTEDYELEEVLMDGTWELNGKTLLVTNDGVTQEGTISKQTATTLEVRINVNDSYTDSGYTITAKVKGVYKFEKVIL